MTVSGSLKLPKVRSLCLAGMSLAATFGCANIEAPNVAEGTGGTAPNTAVGGTGGTDGPTGGVGGDSGGIVQMVPFSLKLAAASEVDSCVLSADRRSLLVSIHNTHMTASPPHEIALSTVGSEHSAVTAIPSLAPGETRVLELLRGPVAGFREVWEFSVSLDGGDEGAQVFGGTCQDLRSRAKAGMAVLQGYYDQGSGLYSGNEWWRGANMLEVAIDFTRETGDASYLDTFDNTFEKNKGANFINEFYDDEGWWALAWIRAYDLTHNQKYLDMAKVLFDDIAASWDADHCGGGVYWKKETDAKTAISNELFLVLAARLHLRTPGDTGPGSYLEWAQREWDWFLASGLISDNFQVIDGLNFDTCGDGWTATFTYNQGVVLGGLVDLWRATGDESLLEMAVNIADATLELQTTDDGVFIEAICHPDCGGGDGVTFKGVFARNIAYLYEVVPDDRYREFLIRQSDSIWQNNRSETNQFGMTWTGPFDEADPARQAAALDAVLGAVRTAELNLAIGRGVTGSAPCAPSEGVDRINDGNARSKWCAAGAGDQSVTIDLGRVEEVSGFVVRHAGSQGEDAAWNTGAFEIAVSSDGTTFADVVTVTGNADPITTSYVPLMDARYVRLHITQAESTTEGGAARIFELEVLGIDRAPL